MTAKRQAPPTEQPADLTAFYQELATAQGGHCIDLTPVLSRDDGHDPQLPRDEPQWAPYYRYAPLTEIEAQLEAECLAEVAAWTRAASPRSWRDRLWRVIDEMTHGPRY